MENDIFGRFAKCNAHQIFPLYGKLCEWARGHVARLVKSKRQPQTFKPTDALQAVYHIYTCSVIPTPPIHLTCPSNYFCCTVLNYNTVA